MRVLLISDLHANLSATEAVLADASRTGWDTVLVLGDLVGYGADPAAVIDAVRDLRNATVIRGNHDKVVAGIDDASEFNIVARHSVEWTAAHLDAERTAYLRDLPQGPLTIDGLGFDIAICHGAPFDEDYYVFDTDDAARALAASEAALVFYGHTHVQIAFREMTGGRNSIVTPLDADVIDVGTGFSLSEQVRPIRTLINPGSVGQPRDGDPRAAYAMLDTADGLIRMRRVEYDVAEAQRRIRNAGLHPSLAERLAFGR